MFKPTHSHPREEDLHGYLDNELPVRQVEELERHLGTCPTCTEMLESLQSLFSQIDRLSDAPLKADLVPLVLQKIEPRSTLGVRWRWVLTLQLAVFSAIVLLLSGSLVTQVGGVLASFRHWLGQSSFQLEMAILIQRIQLTISQFQPEVPGVLELSIPRPFSPSPEIGWFLIGIGACLVWLLANRWLLTQAFTAESTPRQGV
jgi:hypothetical protein